MITFETKEEFDNAVKDIIRQMSVHVSDYTPCYYDNDSKGITVELGIERDVISTDSVSI